MRELWDYDTIVVPSNLFASRDKISVVLKEWKKQRSSHDSLCMGGFTLHRIT